MPEEQINIGSPITEFVKQTKDQITAGLGDWELKEPIHLELSATVSGKVGGGIDIKVINFGAKVEAEQVQKINMVIGPKSEVEEAKRKAEIALAKAQEWHAGAIALKGT
jgi:hypothetical protein